MQPQPTPTQPSALNKIRNEYKPNGSSKNVFGGR